MNHTLSAILRGSWLIDNDYAQSQLPLVLGLIQGKLSGAEFLTGSAEFEKPFAIAPNNKRVDMYVWDRERGKVFNELGIPSGSIAVIPIIGPVIKYNGSCGESGMVQRQSWINDAINFENIIGIISYLDTPGGQADGTPQFTDFIKGVSKPSVALIEGGAFSAGAWIASGHNKIFAANKHSKMGSIGAFTTIMDFRGYFEQNGVKIHTRYPSVSKDKNLSYREAIEGRYELLDIEISELAKSFITEFAANRSSTLNSEEWNTGRVFSAAESQRIGLIDGVKSLNEVVSEIRGNKIISLNPTTPINISSNNSNNKDMKFTNLAALAANTAPTTEQIDLANGDLTTEGITSVTLVAEAFITEASNASAEAVSLREEATGLNSTLEQSNADLAEAQASVAELTNKVTELEGRLAILPGATHNNGEGEGNDPEAGGQDSIDSVMDNLPHNQRAANSGF